MIEAVVRRLDIGRLHVSLVRNDWLNEIIIARKVYVHVDRLGGEMLFITFRVWRYWLNIDWLR